ncbi:hypothetical protein F5Y15DRAFT_29634 [Xylariaceae sp. FL0016]|nr:hypothetical protein F5Y15DRAFT_29634 [Xylariaceae sp. FL0016]
MSQDLQSYQLLVKEAPQDPYLPREDSYGPSFLDTGACLCSLQTPDSGTITDDTGDTTDDTNADSGSSDDTNDTTDTDNTSDTNDNDNTNSNDSTDDTNDTTDADSTSDTNDNTSSNDSTDETTTKKSRRWGNFKRETSVSWQCIGNQTQGVYSVTTGKWFNSLQGGTNTDLPIWDASNGIDTTKVLTWQNTSQTFVDADPNTFTPYDKACTGVNQTIFSTAFYRAYAQKQAGETQVDAAPCWRPGGVPVEIQNVTSWEADGCPQGFLCANNTVNSLPQFCPPISECQKGRLSGRICSFQGKNIGMGPFEPVVCQKGWYCPTDKGGKERFVCPAGHYCQPGAATPTPCAVGSYCPEKSAKQRFLIPFAILIIVDILMLVGLIFYAVKKRFRNHRSSHTSGKPKGISAISRSLTGYKELRDTAADHDDDDHEMMPMSSTFMPGQDPYVGFHAALEMPRPNRSQTRLEDFEGGFSPQLRMFVDSMRKATDAAQFGLSFNYADLSFHPKGAPRPILQNVTGSIERGSLTAVMGGSGAGKSTFVNVLMGKTANTGGAVMVNNVPGKIKRYKKLIGYVPQDDIVLPELTVYENILHSARIRLPRTWADVDIKAHVNSVIDCLELSHVHDSLVGSVGKPVISGGQRKRVSIGMELAAAPMAIFLDEPTSGLDATSASSIMKTLKAIARLGISVIVIIHQPRMEIFEMLDDLILLGNGQIIYEGPENNVQPFFEAIGYHFPEHSNYGDVVTDIITGNGRIYKSKGDISKEALIANWASSHQNAQIKDKHQSLQPDRSSIMQTNTIHRSLLKSRGAPRVKQGWLCLKRAMLQQWRTKPTFWFEMGLASLAGLLLGLAESAKDGILFVGIYNAPLDVLSIASDTKSVPELALLTAIAIGLVSGAPGVKVFSEEMLLYRREAEAGHSRIAYFLAKNVSVIPRMLLGCMHFTTVILLLAVPVIGWGTAFGINLLYFYAIYGLASCISMVVRREDAPLFATMIALIVGILSGAAPPLSKVKQWHMEWLWRASPGTWLAEAYFGQNVEPFRYLYDVELAARITGFHLDWLKRNMATLMGIGTVYRILAFLGLTAGSRLRV